MIWPWAGRDQGGQIPYRWLCAAWTAHFSCGWYEKAYAWWSRRGLQYSVSFCRGVWGISFLVLKCLSSICTDLCLLLVCIAQIWMTGTGWDVPCGLTGPSVGGRITAILCCKDRRATGPVLPFSSDEAGCNRLTSLIWTGSSSKWGEDSYNIGNVWKL